MAGPGWESGDRLSALLASAGWEFEFHQAVTLLRRLQARSAEGNPPEGAGAHGVRFSPRWNLTPSANEVQRIERITGVGGRVGYHLVETFFGMYGAGAPGPAYLLEAAAGGSDPEAATALRDFLDIFNHRLIAMYHEAWRKFRWPLRFERSGGDTMSRCFLSLIGLKTNHQRGGQTGDPVPGHGSLDAIQPSTRLLRYLGALSQRVRCPANLRGVLWDYFDGPVPGCGVEFVEVEEYVTRWLSIDASRRCRVGESKSRLGLCAGEDEEIIVGERVRDAVGRFRVVMGPLGIDRFRRFLPIGADYHVLLALTGLFRSDRMDYEIKLRLRKDEVPPLQLDGGGLERLGWSTWLGSPGVERIADGVVRFGRRAKRAEAAAA